MFGPCKNCGELEEKNRKLDKKNIEVLGELNKMYEEERQWKLREKTLQTNAEELREQRKTLKEEKGALEDRLGYIDGALKILNAAICGSIFAGEFYSTLTINKYGSVVFTLRPRGYRKTITVPEIKVRMYDSRDHLYAVEIAKFGNGVIDDILIKIMEERDLKYKNDVERNTFEICTTTSLNPFFKTLDEIFTEVQTRYEKLLDGLKPKEEPQKKK